jgi:sulfur carrier protein ThiS
VTITIKLFAHLAKYLPPGSSHNESSLAVADGATVADVIATLHVPPDECHLVLIDGRFVEPAARTAQQLTEGSVLAIWPLVAGG